MNDHQKAESSASHPAAGWLLTALLVSIGVAYAFAATIGGYSPSQQYRAMVSEIVSDNVGTVEIDHFSAPLIQRTPLSPTLAEIGIIPQQFKGFFTVKGRCDDNAFPYHIRHVSNGRIQGEIDGLTAMRLRQCI